MELNTTVITTIINDAKVKADTRRPDYLGNSDARTFAVRELATIADLKEHDLLVAKLDDGWEELEDEAFDVRFDRALNIVVLALMGGLYPKEFSEALEAKKVFCIGDKLPLGFPGVMEEFVTFVDFDEFCRAPHRGWTIWGRDLSHDEEELLGDFGAANWTPDALFRRKVAETVVTPADIGGVIRALGGFWEDGAWVIRRGYKVLRLSIKDGRFVFNDRLRLKERLFIAGILDGDPEAGLVPARALFWALLYACGGAAGNTMSGRLAFLTELFEEDAAGVCLEGRALEKVAGTVGVLALGLQPDGWFKVGNGSSDDRMDAMGVAAAKGHAVFMQHQGNGVVIGAGARAMGVGRDGDVARVSAYIDKAPKAFNRPALAAKPTCFASGLTSSAFRLKVR